MGRPCVRRVSTLMRAIRSCGESPSDQPPVLHRIGRGRGGGSGDPRAHKEKRPDDRYPGAMEMAKDLRQALLLLDDSREIPDVRAMTRLIVLPFRALRPDPETDFLAFSLPDAITSSVSAIDTLVVRSSLAASRFAGDTLDLRRIAAEVDVDVVLSGTLLRAGDKVRVTTQLVEAPGGTLLWAQTSQVSLGDISSFRTSWRGRSSSRWRCPSPPARRGTCDATCRKARGPSNLPARKPAQLSVRHDPPGP